MEHSAVYPQQARQGQPLIQHCVLQSLVNLQVVPYRPLQVKFSQSLLSESGNIQLAVSAHFNFFLDYYLLTYL